MTVELPPIIGLVGFPTHGKSTAQRFLSELGVEARDDASALRRRVCARYNLTHEDVTTQEGKLKVVPGINGKSMTVRQLLGDYGQIHGEIPYGPNYWIELALDELREEGVTHPVSFGSLRRSQPSAVKARGGFILEVLDPRKPVADLHYFDEFDRDDVDCVVVNDGTEADLAFGVLMAVSNYLKPSNDSIKRYVREYF